MRTRKRMPTVSQMVVSLLIVASGVWGGQALEQVDQDLRILYAEYTLAATDLGHMNARLIRYRTTILRAIEADTERKFNDIASSFPDQRAHIEATIDRYMKATQKTAFSVQVKEEEKEALVELRDTLEQYLHASQRTLKILSGGWKSASPGELRRSRDEAERYAAEHAGPKLIAVSFALDRLLEIVAKVAGEARNEAEHILRLATSIVIGVSVVLVVIVLSFPVRSRP